MSELPWPPQPMRAMLIRSAGAGRPGLPKTDYGTMAGAATAAAAPMNWRRVTLFVIFMNAS